MTHAHYMHDGGGGGSNLYGRTQRELLAYVSSPELNSLDHVHDMWTDVSQRAGQIRELIQQRLDQLTAEGGWTGPGAEAYRSMITDDLIKHLATLEDTAQTYATKLDPVTGAVSAAHTTGEQNNIPWDIQTQWHTRRQHVDQTFWGRVDEFFTGDDDAYLEAVANAPTEVVTGGGSIVTTVPKPQWDATLAANPTRPVPSIFTTVATPVSQHQDQFDRLMEHHQLNSVTRGNVQGAALSVDSALGSYRPETVEPFTYRGGAYSETATGGMVPPGGGGGTAPSAGSGGTPTPAPGGTVPPPASGGGSSPGGGGVTTPPSGGSHPGDGGYVPPPTPGPGVTPGGPGTPVDPQVPIVDPGPGGDADDPIDGIIGDPGTNPSPLPVGGTSPGTGTAGLPGIGSPVAAAGAPAGPVLTGSPVANTTGIGPMAAPGGMAGGGFGGGLGGSSSGMGRMPTGTPGTSFQIGPNGKAAVNPGSAGNIVGSGSDAGRGGMGGAPMGARRTQQSDGEEKTEQTDEVWLEEDQNVWGANQGAPPSVIR